MNETVSALAELKDIHLPADVSQLPLSIGWWILAVLLGTAIYFTFKFGLALVKRNLYRRQGIKQLELIFNNVIEDAHLLAQISALLKRVVLHGYPESRCQSLSGVSWQSFLITQVAINKQANLKPLEELMKLYQADICIDVVQRKQLKEAVIFWLKHHDFRLKQSHMTVDKPSRGVADV